MTNLKWVVSAFSRNEVLRAGETLVSLSANEDQRSKAMDIVSNWRAAHAYPMHALLISLRRSANEVDSGAIVVQRLKRIPSILGKLSRFPAMKLHRMQDISGCRAIVNSVKDVEKLASRITGSRTRHKLHKKSDYILEPKETGYRGIHLIYKYNGEKPEYVDYFVELQLRSKVQHAWATAVEIVDTFTSQALKASDGSQDWLDFFRYVGAEFAKIEKRPIGNHVDGIDTAREVVKLAAKLNVVKKLSAFTIAAAHITDNTKKRDSKTDYFLLELTNQAQAITVTQFSSASFDLATAIYLEKEKQSKDNLSYDIVLVAASSMHALRSAYPNYFADSKSFLTYLAKLLS